MRPASGSTVVAHRTSLRALARAAALAASFGMAGGAAATPQTLAVNTLADFSLEQLGEIRVTSVTGRPRAVHEAPASIFVITAEDIRRSAATTLPQALRLAPNLQVAQLNAGQYAISARGFNNAIGNKLLVLIDGRTVYSPLFAGVFWDAQDVMLEDVERIEVISGPGATLWGANAVNGVINVVTRSARETQGLLVSASAGRTGSTLAARHGGVLAGGGSYRLYAMRLQRDNTERRDGVERPDASAKLQVGAGADWERDGDRFSLQGDFYTADPRVSGNLAPGLGGANLVAHWRRSLADGSSWHWQAYADHERRDDPVLFNVVTDTLDLQFDHAPATSGPHRLLWGAGLRHARSKTGPSLVLFSPAMRDLGWAHVFVQDEVQLGERLSLTAGLKLERNDYTGVESLPSLRAAWQTAGEGLLWASLSRAVRAPARVDREFFFPARPPHAIQGGPEFRSEVAKVLEIGYRQQPAAGFSYSLTAFHHDYDGLRGGRPAPTFIENRNAGTVTGLEGWASLDLSPAWRLSGGFVNLHKSLQAEPGSSPTSVADLGNDPSQQWLLRSSTDLPGQWALDLTVRHVGALPSPAVEGYIAADLRLSWQPQPRLTISLLVQNLFDRNHIEFNAPATASEIPRSAMLALEWRAL